jgi:hypothetical protein
MAESNKVDINVSWTAEEPKSEYSDVIKDSIKSIKKGDVLAGVKMKLDELVDKTIIVKGFIKTASLKDDCDYYYRFSGFAAIIENGEKKIIAFNTHNASKNITLFFDRVLGGVLKMPPKLVVRKRGNTFFFDGYDDYDRLRIEMEIGTCEGVFEDSDFA